MHKEKCLKKYWLIIGFLLFFLSCKIPASTLQDNINKKIFENIKMKQSETKAINKEETINPKIEEVLWEGENTDYKFILTTQDLYIESSKRKESLFSDYSKEVSNNLNSSFKENDECELRFRFHPMSIVETLIAFEQETMIVCFNNYENPGREVRWITIDISKKEPIPFTISNGIDLEKTGRLAKLTDYFSDDIILEQLLLNMQIKSIVEANPSKKIKSTLELFSLMKGEGIGKNNIYSLTRESFLGFVIDRVEGDNVIVKLQLIPIGRRDLVDFIEISLPISDKLSACLKEKELQKKNLLAIDSNKVVKKDIEFSISLMSVRNKPYNH